MMKLKLLTALTIVSSTMLVACASSVNQTISLKTVKNSLRSDTKITSQIKNNTKHINIISSSPKNIQAKYLVMKPTGIDAEKIQEAIKYTNQLRAEKKLLPLKVDESLSAYAQVRAREIEKVFAHTRPNGDSIGNVGENIASGGTTAYQTVMIQWKNSPTHYKNIINPNYNTIGIGMVYIPNSKNGYYWSQISGFKGHTTPYAFTSNSNNIQSENK